MGTTGLWGRTLHLINKSQQQYTLTKYTYTRGPMNRLHIINTSFTNSLKIFHHQHTSTTRQKQGCPTAPAPHDLKLLFGSTRVARGCSLRSFSLGFLSLFSLNVKLSLFGVVFLLVSLLGKVPRGARVGILTTRI